MFCGFLGGLNNTSCVEINSPFLEPSYIDKSLGVVYNRKVSKSEKKSREFIWSAIWNSSLTTNAVGKFVHPIDWRFYRGKGFVKLYYGFGFQYDCLVMQRGNNYLLDALSQNEMSLETHHLSSNFQAGFLLGRNVKNAWLHILAGVKLHEPLAGSGNGYYLNNNGIVDFSEDKSSFVVSTTISLSFGENSVMMIEYSLPIREKRAKDQGQLPFNTLLTQKETSFLESTSQSLVVTWLFHLD